MAASVAIVIPVWNRGDLLARTIRNVLDQTVTPSEIIVVDDHSTDGTPGFIRDQFGDRVTILRNAGKGPGSARNTGLQHTTAQYIKFFDSDDLMTNNTVAQQLDILQNSNGDCIYSAYFHAQQVNELAWRLTDPAVLQYDSVPRSSPLSHHMTNGLFITIPSFMFRRDLLEKVGPWRTDITTYEDWDFLWRVAKHQPYPLHSNSCAFLYRKHGTQTTGSSFNSSQRDRDKMVCFFDILKDIKGRSDINSVDRLMFETTIAKTLRKNADQEWSKQWHFKTQRAKYLLGDIMSRIASKAGRMITGTDWHIMHGPRIDMPLVQHYLELIDPRFVLELPGDGN